MNLLTHSSNWRIYASSVTYQHFSIKALQIFVLSVFILNSQNNLLIESRHTVCDEIKEHFDFTVFKPPQCPIEIKTAPLGITLEENNQRL